MRTHEFIATRIYDLGQNRMEQQTPFPPKSRMKPREGQKGAIFPSLNWGGGGGLVFPFILSTIAIWDKIKWNNKPPSPQIKDEAARRARTRHFPILDLEGEGGSRCSIYFVQDCRLLLFLLQVS